MNRTPLFVLLLAILTACGSSVEVVDQGSTTASGGAGGAGGAPACSGPQVACAESCGSDWFP